MYKKLNKQTQLKQSNKPLSRISEDEFHYNPDNDTYNPDDDDD